MDKVKYIFKRIWLNKSIITKQTCTYVSIVFTLWGFVSLFSPLEGLFPPTMSLWCKLLLGVLVFLVVTVFAILTASYVVLCSNENTIFTSNTNHKVIVQYGDMYSADVIMKGYQGRRNIVVSANRCFDTIVDDNLVSQTTQHGQVMRKLYSTKKYDEYTLNQALQQSLSRIQPETHLTIESKPEGNLERYACGTVAELTVSENLTYFFLGLSKFNEQLAASTTKAEYVLAFQKLIEFCNVRSQGYPVILPLMGTGLSRANISHKEALNYMVSALRMNLDIINCDFHIVVLKDMKDKVSIKNI